MKLKLKTTMKFKSLMKFRSLLDQLSPEGLTLFINHLIQNDRASTIISGLFHELYSQGESNTQEFFNQLVDVCNSIILKDSNNSKTKVTLTKEKQKQNNNTLSNLPDPILSHIGSYVTLNDLLIHWNHVNRRFLQIGMQEQTVAKWDYDSIECDDFLLFMENAQKKQSKFSIEPMLRLHKLKQMDSSFEAVIDITKLKSITKVNLCMWRCHFMIVSVFYLNKVFLHFLMTQRFFFKFFK